MRTRRAILIAVLAVLLTGPSVHADQDHFATDPAGDANSASCGLLLLAPQCLSISRPSEPAIDMLTFDVMTPGHSLVADIGVLDLDHPIVGQYGSDPEDGARFTAAFQIGDGQNSWALIQLVGERDTNGNVTDAYLEVYSEVGNPSTTTRPLDVAFDTMRNRVRLATPFSVLNDAIREVCANCPAIERGTELRSPSTHSAVIDRDPTFGEMHPAEDYVSASTSYFVE